ncbi:MAG: hypothetical protein NTW87_27910 [Planctomycetota bacterium]|nr:hypothetical protein [Planctomycetota bacterium]
MDETQPQSADGSLLAAQQVSFSAQVRKHLPFLLLLAYLGIVFHGVLFATQGVYERDAFYHARYSQLLPERGLSREFPWMQFTVWNHAFADKDFLYHVLLAPFCLLWPEALDGAKFGTIVMALAALTAVYALLCRLKAPWPILWVLLLAFGSGLFLNRLLMVRSHVLSISLMVVAWYAIMRARFWPCFAVAFVYAWSYSVPLGMLATAVAAEAGRRLLTKPAEWHPRTILATALGLGAGLVVHPYSPHSLYSLWMFLRISAAGAMGGPVELGSEFRPLRPGDVMPALAGLVGALLVAVAGAVLLRQGAVKGRALSAPAAAALGAALAWFAAMFVFMRMVEYFAPLAIIAAALVARDWAGDGPPFRAVSPQQRPRVLACALACVLLVAGLHEFSLLGVREVLRTKRPYFPSEQAWQRGRYFAGAAEWMSKNLKPHATVINFHWDDFPELFYAAPRQYYLVGLDPTFMRLAYPEHMAVLERMRTEAAPLDFATLGRLFNSEYVIMRRYRAAEYALLKSRAVQPVYEDETAVIYRTGFQATAAAQ